MKRVLETSERAPRLAERLPPRRASEEGETTIFWRPPMLSGERHARRRTAAYATGAVVALVGSLVGLIGWARAPAVATGDPAAARQPALAAMAGRAPALFEGRAPIRLAALSIVAGAGDRGAAEFTSPAATDARDAVLEAIDVTEVRASDGTAGVVRHTIARGSPVSRGSPLVTLRRPDLEPARRLAALDALLELHDESGRDAPAIDRARAEYEAAVARSSDVAVVRAPAAGVVIGANARVGDVVAAGDELARIAATLQLVVPAGDVDGEGADCRVALLDRGRAVLDGKLVPPVADAHSRTLVLARLPADAPLGAVGRVKAVCR